MRDGTSASAGNFVERGHAIMPVVVHAVSRERFDQWVEQAKQEFADAEPLPSPTQVAETPTARQQEAATP